MPIVEHQQCRAMSNGNHGRARKPFLKQPVQPSFGRLIKRGGSLIKEKIIRLVQDSAGDAEALLLSE